MTVMKENSMKEYKRGSNLALEPVDMIRGPLTLYLEDRGTEREKSQLVLFACNFHYC